MADREITVNVEKIMEEIRAEAAKLPHESVPDFNGCTAQEADGGQDGRTVLARIRCEASWLIANADNPYYRDPGTGVRRFFKRVIRRVNKFWALPMSEQQSAFNEQVARSLKDQCELIRGLNSSFDDLVLSVSREISSMREAARVPQPALSRQDSSLTETEIQTQTEPAEANTYRLLDYFKFQNDFRGTQAEIEERQRTYLPYFRGKQGKVLDLGCGRGEFLRLLKDENIPAFGIDMYSEYEAVGKLCGVDIRVGDGLAFLQGCSEPLGGIFCAQVIEHLGFQNVERLCSLAFEKLESGAFLVLETPNPMCLSAMTNAFYIDPSHDKPVHPLLMEYLLKSIGFSEVQLLWPDHSLEQLPHIESESIKNLQAINAAVDRVSRMLYGSQDYAVVAKKP